MNSSMTSSFPRRRFLLAGVSGAGALALGGCDRPGQDGAAPAILRSAEALGGLGRL